MRYAGWTLVLGITACAGPERTRPEPLQVAPAGHQREPVPHVHQPADEAALRAELATGPRPAHAAAVLVDWLADPAVERFREALAVIRAARRRRPEDADLAQLEAELLRDLGRRREARSLLEARAGENPGELRPRAWLSLAELAALAGDREQAREALAHFDGCAADDDPLIAQARVLRGELERQGAPGISVRDVLADVRGGDSITVRMKALRLLVRQGGADGRHAAALALDDPAAPVRILALRSLPADENTTAEAAGAALGDPQPAVRRAAARLLARHRDPARIPELFEALAREEDEAAFEALHGALSSITGWDVSLPPLIGDVERRRAVAQWRRVLSMGGTP